MRMLAAWMDGLGHGVPNFERRPNTLYSLSLRPKKKTKSYRSPRFEEGQFSETVTSIWRVILYWWFILAWQILKSVGLSFLVSESVTTMRESEWNSRMS